MNKVLTDRVKNAPLSATIEQFDREDSVYAFMESHCRSSGLAKAGSVTAQQISEETGVKLDEVKTYLGRMFGVTETDGKYSVTDNEDFDAGYIRHLENTGHVRRLKQEKEQLFYSNWRNCVGTYNPSEN